MAEIRLYSPIFSFTAEMLIEQLEDFKDEQVVLRINSNGGGVLDSWGIFAKVREHGNVFMKVDGAALSSSGNLLFYAHDSEALDVSNIMFHRADMDNPTPEQQVILDKINADLKLKMKARLDNKKFKDITGHTIDDLFKSKTRINVWLTGKQAKAIGLIDKVVTLSVEGQKKITAEANTGIFEIAAKVEPKEKEITNSNNTDMAKTIAEFKTENPGAYAEIIALGKAEGIEAEQNRVNTWMVYKDIDAKAVAEGIESGKDISTAQSHKFVLASTASKQVEGLEDASAEDVETEEQKQAKADALKDDGTPKTEAEKVKDAGIEAFYAEVGANQKEENGLEIKAFKKENVGNLNTEVKV